MREVIGSIESEFRRYRGLIEGTLAQLDEDRICRKLSPESNSIATLVWHLSGNLRSRFTDFLTTDGEKPWREREDEFAERRVDEAAVGAKLREGWDVLTAALADLSDDDLGRTVTIRGVEHTVSEALHRSLAHTALHVGQITFLGKLLAGDGWKYLSIPPGGTAAYNADPTREKA